MRITRIPTFLILAISLPILGGIALAQQDRYTLKVPDGLAFSEFRGYDTWQDVAPSATEGSIKSILAKKKNPVSPYFVEVPDTLKSLAFIEKDSKRFPDTHGWAYAKWDYDPASGTFTPAPLSARGHECGYTCHTL